MNCTNARIRGLLFTALTAMTVYAASSVQAQPRGRLPSGVRPPPTGPSTPAPASVAQPAVTAPVTLAQAYRDALRQPAVRDASMTEIVRQLRTNRPIAFVNGYWVTPIDAGRMYGEQTIRGAIDARLAGGPRMADLLQQRGANIGLVFTANEFADVLLGNMHREVMSSLARALQNVHPADFGAEGVAAGRFAGATGVFGAAIRYGDMLGDQIKAIASNTAGRLLGAVSSAPLPMDHPEADPDGDGTPNRLDADDDGDGTNDDQDAYPYDDTEDICDCGGVGDGAIGIAFTSKYSKEVMSEVLGSLNLARQNAQYAVLLGVVSNVTIAVAFGQGIR